jgi:hypothetical protein
MHMGFEVLPNIKTDTPKPDASNNEAPWKLDSQNVILQPTTRFASANAVAVGDTLMQLQLS